MTQTHRFVDATSYDEDDIADVFYSLYGCNFVLPYDEGLEVVGDNSIYVYVKPGMAQVYGIIYENTEEYTFSPDSQGGGNNRIDRVVLRKDSANNQVRITVIKGTAAVAPSLPALGANDFPLGYVWIPDGFTSGVSTISPIEVHDERVFYQPAPIQSNNPIENLATNAEFMAYSAPATGTDEPEEWTTAVLAGASSIQAAGAINNNTPRGRAVACNWANVCSVNHNMLLTPDPENPTATMFTIKGTITLTSGTPTLTFARVGGPTILERKFRRTGTYEFALRGTIDFVTNPGIYYIGWSTGGGETGVFTFGPILVVRGYVPGPFAIKREILKFDHEVTDANWNATVKATNFYTIDLTADFGGNILRSVQAILGRVFAADDASGASNLPYMAIANYDSAHDASTYLNLARSTNSAIQEDQLIVGVSQDATPNFGVQIVAAGNLAATIKLLGIST